MNFETTSAYQTDIYLAKLVPVLESYVRAGTPVQYIHSTEGVSLYQISDNVGRFIYISLAANSITIQYTEHAFGQPTSKIKLNNVSEEGVAKVERILNNTNVGYLISDMKIALGEVN